MEPEIASQSKSDPTSEQTGKLARRGVRVLFGRQVASQLITVAGGIALARLLTPGEFAIFAICQYLQQLFSRFTNVGLGYALIQQKEAPSEQELRVAFTTQLSLLSLICFVAVIASPLVVGSHPELRDQGYTGLFVMLIVSLWVGALRSIPMIKLERGMDYTKTGIIEVLEVLAYQIVCVSAALLGWGVWALATGFIVKSIVASIAAYHAARWCPKVAWDATIARRLISFGLPTQLIGFVNQLAMGVAPLIIAPIIGTHAFGLMLWGASLGAKLSFLSSSIPRVAFSHFCRVENEKRLLDAYSKYVVLSVSIVGTWVILVDGLGQSLLVPLYGEKWSNGLTAATVYAAVSTVTVSGFISLAAVSASGKPTRGLVVAGLRCCFAYAVAGLLAPSLGILAGPATDAAAGLFFSLTLSYQIGKSFALTTLRTLTAFVISAGLGVSVSRTVSGSLEQSIPMDLIGTALGVLVYMGVMSFLVGSVARSFVVGEISPIWHKLFGSSQPANSQVPSLERA